MRGKHLLARVVLVLCVAATPALAGQVKTLALPGDAELWYMPDAAVPVVDIRLSFAGAGDAYSPPGKEGIAAMAAAMLGEGAGARDATEFAQALDAKAITLNFDADADRLEVHLYTLKEHAAEAAALLRDALTAPRLAAPDLARVAQQMESARQQREENPGFHAARQLARHVFSGHPYARAPEGEAGAPIAWTEADLRAYYARALTRSALTITAAGDVDAALLHTMLDPLVEALPEGSAPGALASAPFAESSAVLGERMQVPQTVVRFAAPAVARSDARFYAVYLLNEILGGGALTSRLGEALRQQKGLVYSVGTGLDVRDGASLLTGQLATRNETAAEAIAATKDVLAKTAAQGVSAAECADAKQYVIGHFPLQMESSGDVSATLMMMRRHGLPRDYLDTRDALFEGVRCEDINRVARTLLLPERFVFSAVGGGEAMHP